MCGQVPVAQLKPNLGAEISQRLKAPKCVAIYSPTALRVRKSSQRVRDSIEIGRYVQAVHLRVVAGISNYKNPVRRVDAGKPI
jgi:hypothetical protein